MGGGGLRYDAELEEDRAEDHAAAHAEHPRSDGAHRDDHRVAVHLGRVRVRLGVELGVELGSGLGFGLGFG